MPEVDPAVAALSLWCVHRDGVADTRTVGDRIEYGAAFETLPLAEQIGVVAHHVLHVTLRHSARAAEMSERLGPSFDCALYALAADAIVNEVLLQGGHALPRPAVRAADLVKENSGAVLAAWDTERLYHDLAGRTGQGRREVDDYSAAKAFAPDIDAADDDGAAPETWKGRLEQAFRAGQSAGSGIGVVAAYFADLPEARVPWERTLRRLMARAVSEVPRLSHKRPAHRWIAREAAAVAIGGPSPVFEPGYARDALRPRLVIALDTSSSVTDTQLDLLAAEALSVTRKSGAEAHILGFDTAVHTEARLDGRMRLKDVEFRRGGGTDFVPVIEAAARLAPSLLIVMTDLDGPVGEAPSFPVVWAVTGPVAAPPFGSVVAMDR